MPDCGYKQHSERKTVNCGAVIAFFADPKHSRQPHSVEKNREIKMLSTEYFVVSVGDHQDTLKLHLHETIAFFAVIISLSSGR